MRFLEIRRHSFTKKGEARGRGSHLSREGVEAARRLGGFLGEFDYVAASTSPRTLETALAMGYAADDIFDLPSPADTGEVEFHAWRQWPDPFTRFRQIAGESPAFRTYAEAQAGFAQDVVTRLDDERAALLVGHGGWIETVIAELVPADALGTVGGSFWHLDGIRLAFSDRTSVAVTRIDRHPR